jgi:hypothetical protein
MGGSGKARIVELMRHPEAVAEPPGGPVWRRPVLILAISVVVIAGALFAAEARRDYAVAFRATARGERCPSHGVVIAEGDSCWAIVVRNVGTSSDTARCTWTGGGFTTDLIAPNEHEVRDVVSHTKGAIRVSCQPV